MSKSERVAEFFSIALMCTLCQAASGQEWRSYGGDAGADHD
jgi:hypothetical protein